MPPREYVDKADRLTKPFDVSQYGSSSISVARVSGMEPPPQGQSAQNDWLMQGSKAIPLALIWDNSEGPSQLQSFL